MRGRVGTKALFELGPDEFHKMPPHIFAEIGPQLIQNLILSGTGIQIGIGDVLAELAR